VALPLITTIAEEKPMPDTTQDPVAIHPLVSPWGRFGLYSFFIDAPEPAIVDTGITTSPAEGMVPELEKLGRRIEDVRWILLTHGHIDHLGGARALWELTGRKAKVVIHEADAPLLRSRRAHVDEYLNGRNRYLKNPEGERQQIAATAKVISGEMEPHVVVTGGEKLDLGGGVTVSVHHIPGHTAGSVAYVVDGQNAVFVGDSVQVHGAANHFPGYEEPAAYRRSLEYLRDVVRPNRLFLGHPYRGADGTPYEIGMDAATAQEALRESLAIEERVRVAALRALAAGPVETDSPYSPFASVAEELGYTGDPALEPSPFFTTLGGYRDEHASAR
jgi:hydroxyacylglutathione hydrolase